MKTLLVFHSILKNTCISKECIREHLSEITIKKRNTKCIYVQLGIIMVGLGDLQTEIAPMHSRYYWSIYE